MSELPEPTPREDPDLDRWVSGGDLDELLREVDRRCERGDWDGVLLLRNRARTATERGHQLWPAATFAEYRLALEAPPTWAAGVVEAGYLAAGPLTEVVAQHHSFSELAPELPVGPTRHQVAQERVLRGESVDPDDAGELPGRLMAWEPRYSLASYLPNGDARFPAPPPHRPTAQVPGGAAPTSDGASDDAASHDADDGARALADAVRHWRTASEGLVRSAGVEGSAADAIGSLHGGASSWVPLSLADAVRLLAWAAASGGARGRRRGAATGRFEAWWVLATLTATDDDWPLDPGPGAQELRWWAWEPGEHAGSATAGWVCRLAVEDPVDGLAWALDATDRVPLEPS